MKLTFILSILILCFYSNTCVLSQNPYDFLQLGISARTAALSGAGISIIDDPSVIAINPSTLGSVLKQKHSVSFVKHVLDINSGQAVYVLPFDTLKTQRIALSALFTNYGTFDQTDLNGLITGTFTANNIAFSGTYSNQLDSNLYYGITGKLIYATLADARSMAFGIDAGLLYTIPKSRTNIGFSLLHIGSQLSTFNGYSDKLPVDVRLGINHRLRGLPLLLNVSLHHLADDADVFFDRFSNFAIGGELTLSKVLDIRVGYDNVLRTSSSTAGKRKLSGFSAGLGIKTKPFLFDYSMNTFGTESFLHRLSLQFSL